MKISETLIELINQDVDNIWYHGSDTLFKEFNNINNRTYREIDVPSWYFTKNKEYAKTYGKHLYSIKLDVNNTFDTTNDSHLKYFIQELKNWGYDEEKISDILSDEFVNQLPYWTCNDAIYVAAMLNFDSIYVEEELVKSIIGISVFDNTKIKILNID